MAATIPGGDAEFNAWLDNFVPVCRQAGPTRIIHTAEIAESAEGGLR